MEATGFVPLSFCMAIREKSPSRKTSQACLCVLMLALALRSIFRIIQTKSHLSELRKILEIKDFFRVAWCFLGFHWAYLTTLHSADNLWHEFLRCPGKNGLTVSSESFLLATLLITTDTFFPNE